MNTSPAPSLPTLTLSRAVAWLGCIVTGWSLNVRWGSESGLGNGPPQQFERLVVGCLLLALIAAAALSWPSVRVGPRGSRAPRRGAKLVAVAAAALVGAIAVTLRGRATSAGIPHVLTGAGWAWLLAGTAMILGAALLGASLRGPGNTGAAPRRPGGRSGSGKRRR
jgi:hypothetical protein